MAAVQDQFLGETAVKGPPNIPNPTEMYDELRKARKQISDTSFEEWLYAPIDGKAETPETEQQALEAEWAEDDLKIRLKVAGLAAIPVLIFTIPIVEFFSRSWVFKISHMWVIVNLPLITFAVITWRRREMRLGLKRPVKGHRHAWLLCY